MIPETFVLLCATNIRPDAHERSEITPSVEVAAKIVEVLDVSLDYLIGSVATIVKDQKMLYRFELMEKISEDER